MNNKETGRAGELAAKSFLEKKGYNVLATNFSNRVGEIDIIAKDAEFLVFVEVKSRRNDRYGRPVEAIGYRKIAKIKNVALLYIQKKSLYSFQPRFDVIEVIYENGQALINHIENAF